MEKYVCIHGHFYQPPRENPWLEDVELQDGAYPYHDWNEKITEECYRQNASSRILGPDKKIIDIVNNYAKISFNFGPTLLSWLKVHAPDVYESVLDADRRSQEHFSGHGAAIAQAYNHIVMPLANRRDKWTQVVWGIRDFESHFGRKPEGMWLPETAVDLQTLDILAENEIKFTILAPHQAKHIRQIGAKHWTNVERDKLDVTKPYLCRLPSGRTINLFFYHGATAMGAASGYLLQNGEVFARKMVSLLSDGSEKPQIAHIATDGETFGHHHRYTDMALAYSLHFIESNNLAKITIYGEYLEKFPPGDEVEIFENSSWSCSHGVERWKSNCGCSYGRFPSGKQQFRGPLREAMDWLRDQLTGLYEEQMKKYVPDPWETKNQYIAVILDRSRENIDDFLTKAAGRELNFDEKVTMLKLLEMQRNELLMYTSCGWFFDDICGIETLQILQYSARAIQLAREVDGKDFEDGFTAILEKAPTNTREYANGKEVYYALIKPANIDLNRVGAHLALSSVFERYPAKIDVYCYTTRIESYDRLDAGIQAIATGRATVESNIVLEKHPIDFAVLHLGNHNLIGAVNSRMPDKAFSDMSQGLKKAFARGDTTEVMRIMNISFSGNSYSLWHLFRDEQRRILYQLLETTWEEIEASFRHIYEHNYAIMQIMRGMNMPLPRALATPAEFIANQDVLRLIVNDDSDLKKLAKLAEEAGKLSLQLDKPTLRFEASRKINRMMKRFEDSPSNARLLAAIDTTLKILLDLSLELDLQTAQNVFFSISKDTYPRMKKKADDGDVIAKDWVEHFKNLAHYVDVILQ